MLFHETLKNEIGEKPSVLTIAHTLHPDKNYANSVVRVHSYLPDFRWLNVF